MSEMHTAENCLFCKIINGIIPAKNAYSDDNLLAFYDINPVAPVHLLIIPKKHISTLNALQSEDALLVGQMMLLAKDLARTHHLDEEGYRLNINCNRNGGQTVYHLHMHLIGGQAMGWPPFPSSLR